MDSESGESILLIELLTILTKNMYIFNIDKIKNIIQDLISQLDMSSVIRFLSPIGNITKLDTEVLNKFKTDSLLTNDLSDEQFSLLEKNFTQNIDKHLNEILPQNVLLNSDVRYPLEITKDCYVSPHKINTDGSSYFNPEILPSAYYNILYLKNSRNPHFEFDLTIYDDDKLLDYNIFFNDNFIISSNANNKNDFISEINKLYDIDITRSLVAQTKQISRKPIYSNKICNLNINRLCCTKRFRFIYE